MYARLTDWKTTWLMGGLLAAVLFGAGRPAAAKEPFRPSAFDETKAVQGFWKTLEIDEHGAFQPMGLMLSEDNAFTLAVADAKGEVVETVKGNYAYKNGVLTLMVNEKPYAEMHVEFADDALDLKAGAKKSHWVKDRVRRE